VEATTWTLADALNEANEAQVLANRAASTIERGHTSAAHLRRTLGGGLDVNRASLVRAGEHHLKTRRSEAACDGTISKEIGYGVMGLGRGRELGLFGGEPRSFDPAALRSYSYEPRTRAATPEGFAALLEAERIASRRHSWAIPRADELCGYAFTGARQAELFAIPKNGVDLSRRVLTIHGTKTKGAVREVPILDELMPVVERRLQTKGPMLFAPVWQRQVMHRNLRSWCADAGIEPLTANDLRRTYATWMAERGVPESLLLKYMGHTSSAMLRRVYSQTTDRMHAGAIAAFGSVLGGLRAA
jgi:integrase